MYETESGIRAWRGAGKDVRKARLSVDPDDDSEVLTTGLHAVTSHRTCQSDDGSLNERDSATRAAVSRITISTDKAPDNC